MAQNQQERLLAEAQAIVRTYRPIEALVPPHWSQGDVFANGIRLYYYRTGGHKPTLLLLHGFNEYGLTWLRVARELEHDYDILMLDARGHGHSDGIAAGGYPPGVNVADLAAFIHALELARPRIIGFSMGGATALNLAAKYPELLHSFVYEGWSDQVRPEQFVNSEGYRAWFNAWLSRLEQLRTMNHEERMLSTLPQLLSMSGGALWPEEEYVPIVESNALFDLDLARDSMKLWSSAYRDNEAETLQRVTCPAFIMKQAASFPTPGAPPTVREESSTQPNVRLVTFENTGHMIHRMAFEQYMSLVRAFLAAH